MELSLITLSSDRSQSLSARPDPGRLAKLIWNLPWIARYPAWRARELIRRATEKTGELHLILVVANHFEPAFNEEPNEFGGFGIELDLDTQMRRLDDWSRQARLIGETVKDHDGTPFRHTNFYPAEQYHRPLLDGLAQLQADGFGEVEIHLHHGVDQPDTAENFRRVLVGFRDALAEEHKCLSQERPDGPPMYAFVHGNWALANSAGGRFCGVDSEMQILTDTGCYADLTLPSAPDQSQVARINAIYQCGHPLSERKPHRSGRNLRVGERPALPVIFTGPLVMDWKHRRRKLPVPRVENSALSARGPLDLARLKLWRNARIGIRGRPEWVFIKLYCHGFFVEDQPALIGSEMRRGLEELLEFADKTGKLKVHFATAREAFNMAMAAVDGRSGGPGSYRDYRLQQIMRPQPGEMAVEYAHPADEAFVRETA